MTVDADVIVVGGGPAGATAAYYAARAGLSTLLLEKSAYPREKPCGDGLTPRAVSLLHDMGIETNDAGWHRVRGMRLVGDQASLEIEWPSPPNLPSYGLTRSREDFDEILAQNAVKAGAVLRTQTPVVKPLCDAAGRVVGVEAKNPDGSRVSFRSHLVIAADGVSSRFALALGLERRHDRPLAVAIRRYFRSPRHADSFLESWHEIAAGNGILPGYGWIFPMGDGRCNVGIGAFGGDIQQHDYRKIFAQWLSTLPPEWGLTEENADGPIRGEGIPSAFNRVPHYSRGTLLVGDAGGVANPFTGEGIAYAMESGYVAAMVAVLALTRRRAGLERERTLHFYPRLLRSRWGGYFRAGMVLAAALYDDSSRQRSFVRRGLEKPSFMREMIRIAINLTDPAVNARDRLLDTVYRVVPKA